MPLRDIQGQAAAVMAVQRMLARERVPGALLFVGPSHVGKRTTALALAQALNCARPLLADTSPAAGPTSPAGPGGPDACGACPSCRKIEAGTHPDVEVIAPDGQFIKIDQVRAVGERLGLNPMQAKRRVIVLAQAERLNVQAANAFLKTLEEPPADTTLVLCAAQAALLPETVVSRCLPVRFGPLSEAVLRNLLAQGERPARGAGPAQPARRAKTKSAGGEGGGAAADDAAPGSAGPGDTAVLDFAVRFAQGSLRPELRGQAGAWYALRDELLAALAELPAGGDLAGERLTRFAAKDSAGFVLEWLETWWRDVAVLAAGGGAELAINADRIEALRGWPERLGVNEALACHRGVLAVRDALTVNVNAALALEGAWLGFKHALQGAGRQAGSGGR